MGGRTSQSRARRPSPPLPAQHQRKPGLESKVVPRPKYEAPEYRPAGKLEGKAALITGGDSGIGRAVAVLFAREGADVAFSFLPEERSDALETTAAIEGGGRRAVAIAGDLRKPAFCRQLVRRAVEELGHLDLLVNNAAFQQQQQDGLAAIDDAQLVRTFETNIFAMFRVTREALEHLPAGGAIINTGSITGLHGHPGLLDYASTKGAIHAFTKSLAAQLVERGIRVNCVAPGPVWTPLNPSDRSAQQIQSFGKHVPMGRPAQPEEIAPAYVFFASSADSSYITGEVLTELGGQTTAG